MPNWNDVLKEIQEFQTKNPEKAPQAIDIIRRKYLNLLYKHTTRNVIAYYSGFLSKPGITQLDINDEDKNGFMMAVHKLDRTKGLDLILHTPGGNIAATQSIVNYLHKMFSNDIRAIIPQIAMSAGTMMACSCKKIIMGTQSNLGPIDPQLRDIPAYGVKEEFRRAFREVKDDPNKALIWRYIIGQYRPTFLSQCENAITWSNAFVREQLSSVMFEGHPDAKEKARKIVRKLVSFGGSTTHERHIHYEECLDIGLDVESMETDNTFQDLILTVHHCFMHSLANTQAFKMIENQLGTAYVKLLPMPIQFQPQPITIPQPRRR